MAGDRGGFESVAAGLSSLSSDLAAVSDVVLAERMTQLVALRSMVDAALVEQVVVFDERSLARYDGQTSTVAWLRSRLRLGGAAVDLVRVARQLRGLPEFGKALAAGEISLEHAGVVAALVSKVGVEAVAEFESVQLRGGGRRRSIGRAWPCGCRR